MGTLMDNAGNSELIILLNAAFPSTSLADLSLHMEVYSHNGYVLNDSFLAVWVFVLGSEFTILHYVIIQKPIGKKLNARLLSGWIVTCCSRFELWLFVSYGILSWIGIP